MYIASNLKLLRQRMGLTQDEVSTALNMKRSTLGGYENSIAQPNLENLIEFSKYFKISIDALVTDDLLKAKEERFEKMEYDFEHYIKGSKLRVLATTVDDANNENVELVPLKAVAGYTNGYSDPEFIRTLPTFQIPFLSRDRKYRTFQITGDSMLPIKENSYIIAEFVQNWYELKDGEGYIILTQDDGIVFKIVYSAIKTKRKLLLKSLNPAYKPYEINITDVKEIWKFTNCISNEIPEPNLTQDELLETMDTLRKDVSAIRRELKGK